MFTEEQKEIGKKALIQNQKSFKEIKRLVDMSFCGFINCSVCPYDLKKQGKIIKCGHVQLNKFLKNLKGSD